MVETLRPLSAGELLDRAIQLYRRHFTLFAGIAAGPFAIVLALQLIYAFLPTPPTLSMHPVASPGAFTSPAGLLTSLGVALLASLWNIIAIAIVNGGTIKAVSRLYLNEPVTITQAWRETRGYVWRISGALFMIGLYIGLCALPFVLLAVFMPRLFGIATLIIPMLMGIIFLLAIPLLIWVYLRYAITIPTLVLENLKIMASLRRSVQLSKGFLGRIFLVFLLVFTLEMILFMVFGGVGAIFGITQQLNAPLWAKLNPFISFLIQMLITPLLTIALSLMVFDFKVRKEGFDVELLLRHDAADSATA